MGRVKALDIPSSAFLGAFLGACLGLPAGFLLIEVIRALTSHFSSRGEPEQDAMEWAIATRGCRVVEETQVAHCWVRTLDFHDLQRLDDRGEPAPYEEGQLEAMLPAMYAVQIAGGSGVGTPPPSPAQDLEEAHRLHAEAVADVRKRLGLPT